jgi:trimethylamine--corrinoid protein Co-methyltransferase
MMHPLFRILPTELINRVLDEAFHLMVSPGIKVQSAEARSLLAGVGAEIDETQEIAHIPEKVARLALETVPHEFYLYNLTGNPTVKYGDQPQGDDTDQRIHFDPGSSGVHILDPDTLEHRPSYTSDLIRLIKVTEMLPQYDAQSTAVICNEVPEAIGDLYRLYLVLLYSVKPIVTGAFTTQSIPIMIDMLSIFVGGRVSLTQKPIAVFDVCPNPPLIWSEYGAQSLIELSRTRTPTQIVSMPLAGATAPVTLLGAVVQHAAECISGITIHQSARPGSPVVWGGAPAIFDMRHGTTPMGAIETAMIDAAYAQVGKSLNLPTHAYMGASDAKIVDAQAGLESGITAIIGALAGINMISGAGMLDFLACQSAEKLVIDAEAIAMAKRLTNGLSEDSLSLVAEMFEGINFKADFLKQKATRQLFKKEQYIPSQVIDRGSIRVWEETGCLDTFTRAKNLVTELLTQYQRPIIPTDLEVALNELVRSVAFAAGIDKFPLLEIDLR